MTAVGAVGGNAARNAAHFDAAAYRRVATASEQGLTLVPFSAQLELFRPPHNPTELMNVSWSCSS